MTCFNGGVNTLHELGQEASGNGYLITSMVIEFMHRDIYKSPVFFFLVDYVEERLRWPIQRPKNEESERLRGERDQIKFIDLRFERWQVA